MAESKISARSFYAALKTPSHRLEAAEIVESFKNADKARVQALASVLAGYLVTNLPTAIDRRNGLQDYRTNPYVLMASAQVMDLQDPQRFADFLFNTKLYMGMETSFGKSIEAAFVSPYPLNAQTVQKWVDAPEKVAEFKKLGGIRNEEKAVLRSDSVWREIDKSCVVGTRR